MNQEIYESYLEILKAELVPALGCTEPIALAYAAALARKTLGCMPEHVDAQCSGNIIKNVKSVTVPNSGGLRGIEAAVILGTVGGDADRSLEVLEDVDDAAREKTKQLLQTDFCSCSLAENVANLYIHIEASGNGHTASVWIENTHTNVRRIEKDGKVLYTGEKAEAVRDLSKAKELLSVKEILNFADTLDCKDVEEVLGRQIEMNSKISKEGLSHGYGAEVGRTLLQMYGEDVKVRARAAAAAGSDARMNGCPLPVIINSGSGNQGMTCSLPVIVYAQELGASKDKLYRALAVSNLTAIHQKRYIGSLSAYCGAVCAACGAGAGIAYLYGMDYEGVSRTITNTIANIGGVVCDGAKSSCAAKIASAVDAAIMAVMMERENRHFKSGEGLVKENVEATIQNYGYVGRVGMKSTDVTILNLMIDKVKPV